MPRLKQVESTEERLVLQTSALVYLGHVALCVMIVAVVSASLTWFLRHYFGILAFIFVGLPGILGVICGFFGCANARSFIFTFDRARDEFVAAAGGAELVRALQEVRLVLVERECSSGGAFSGDSQPTYALAVMFADGTRCRLEGGISVTGTGRGPEELHRQGEVISRFLGLPQLRVPILDVTRQSEEPQQDDPGLTRWLTCQGMAPRLEPALQDHTWVEAPEGPVQIPAAAARLPMRLATGPAGQGRQGSQHPFAAQQAPFRAASAAAQSQQAAGRVAPVVLGQAVQRPEVRMMQVVVPEGARGGQSVAVMGPDGAQVQTVIPPNARPGQVLTIQYCPGTC